MGHETNSKSLIQPTWNKKLSILTLSILDNSTSSRCICHSEGRNSLPIAHPLVTSRCCSQLDSSTRKYYYVKGNSSLVVPKQLLLSFGPSSSAGDSTPNLFFLFRLVRNNLHRVLEEYLLIDQLASDNECRIGRSKYLSFAMEGPVMNYCCRNPVLRQNRLCLLIKTAKLVRFIRLPRLVFYWRFFYGRKLVTNPAKFLQPNFINFSVGE